MPKTQAIRRKPVSNAEIKAVLAQKADDDTVWRVRKFFVRHKNGRLGKHKNFKKAMDQFYKLYGENRKTKLEKQMDSLF